ncbi:ABC transporter substrate-binding protein [Pseudomaricurvus alkylphenolicus]|uniref:penicillin-binding protein activator n=1 Tax=Pseudomaricurvus alkylphenolicus TaxID=1306991 RepID=UPI00141E79DC|nr:penicillin-binding protein activator [Pseudomaricurvus alkylphenolicus]NIB40085.1 ABC transporter substrate-binding protein [Pseudomaricurvus alkylphenolicus]
MDIRLQIRHWRRLGLTALALALFGCGGSTPVVKGPITPEPQPQQEQVDINGLLNRAQLARSPVREQLLLEAASHLHQRQESHWARNLLSSVDPALLDDSRFVHYTLLFSDIALGDDAYFLAQRILTNPRLDQQWQLLTEQQQITLRQRRADLFMLLGETNASIKERLALQPLLDETTLGLSNQDVLWRTLMTMPLPELQYRAERSKHAELKGWYQLALISKNNQSNLEKQQTQVNLWRQRWPEHPASQRLPKDLQLLQQLIDERPQQVALLLPQQGRLSKAGKAVRDGFVAAYYQALKKQSSVPELKFYDSASGDIRQTYQQAVADGADMIIGPLDKDRVTQLSQLDELAVPTLAVNYANAQAGSGQQLAKEPPRQLFQFGLSAEDEARQIARRAWVEGHRYAMILTTAAGWGVRSAEAFREAWEAQGGTILREDQFTGQGDFSKVIKSAMHIDQSQKRARDLRAILNKPMEFEPRRRQDADMIFLVARPNEARQIKPTLDFHYASKLPVYATSHIYGGTSDQKIDRDLNNIRFSTLPWFFDRDSAEKRSINAAANPAPSYQRLYALGVDSFQLYPRLKQLQQSAETRLYGVTGSLSMTMDRRIERQQIWAQMRNGRASAMPMVVSSRP